MTSVVTKLAKSTNSVSYGQNDRKHQCVNSHYSIFREKINTADEKTPSTLFSVEPKAFETDRSNQTKYH